MAAFDWSQFLILAKDLGSRSEEAALRSAISRRIMPLTTRPGVFAVTQEFP